ncbi:hypothetical protein [Shimia sp. SDUM112013]|uniref:hypothetical protein n=1 Tax=Shimia sp. SDUM112013 TaxID=3136160 RepID=UPI0032EE0111
MAFSTSHVNMINLQVLAEDQIAIDKATIDPDTGRSVYDLNRASNPKHYIWQSEYQTIPQGMDGRPEQFAERLREALPQVNNLRLGFNEFSFNPDGSLHEQYERFLTAAAAHGFEITFLYAGGDAQNIGNGNSAWGHSDLGNAAAYEALQENFTDLSGAWASLLDWLDQNSAVAEAVFGFELMNEPAGYRFSIRENGPGEGYDLADFVQLYADHVIALSDMIQPRADGHILVDGWGFAGDFETLDQTRIANGVPALEYIRAGIGEALIWSAHLFPGWSGTDDATTREELEQILDAHFAPLAGDAVLVTETNATGTVNNFEGGDDITDLFVASYEWFAENGIGLGWWPGAETGASNFVVIDGNGSLRFLHQHSFAHGMNAYSLDEAPAAMAGNDRVDVDLVAGRLRNERYEQDYADTLFDEERLLGTAFGYAGNDTLTGTDTSNDFLYGGTGRDSLLGGLGDDFLFGQQGDDVLSAEGGINHLFGGSGDDTLLGQAGYDQLAGGTGADLFITNGVGHDVITDFDGVQDRIDLNGAFETWAEAFAQMASVDADNDGAADDLMIRAGAGRSVTVLNLSVEHVHVGVFENLTVPAGVIYGTQGNDTLRGGEGTDTLIGQDGADILIGGGGNDVLSGGTSNADLRDILYGGQGNDSLDGGYGNDQLRGDSGRDTLVGGFGADTLIGGEGDDGLMGGAFADQLFGGDGGDFLNGGFGHDLLNGGGGADRFYHLGIRDHGSDWVQDYSATGGDVLHFGIASATESQFQVNTTHTTNAAGERSGDDNVEEAFVIYRPTGQIMWALIDGAGQDSINLQIGGQVFDLMA